MKIDFPKPLDQWLDEPVEIATIDPIIKHGKVVGTKEGKRTVVQKTHYSEAPFNKFSCAESNHYWCIPDPHEHVAHCKNCPKRQFIRAVFERVVDGKIVDRDTTNKSA